MAWNTRRRRLKWSRDGVGHFFAIHVLYLHPETVNTNPETAKPVKVLRYFLLIWNIPNITVSTQPTNIPISVTVASPVLKILCPVQIKI
jgi:hypothetical protein